MIESIQLGTKEEENNGSGLLKELESLLDRYKDEEKKKSEAEIPIELFSNKELGTMEILVKYLKENRSMKLGKIANLVKRDNRTVWSSYNSSKKKFPLSFSEYQNSVQIPVEIFANRKLSPLEALVMHLKETLDLSITKISDLLNKDYQTVWQSYNHGTEKKSESLEANQG